MNRKIILLLTLLCVLILLVITGCASINPLAYFYPPIRSGSDQRTIKGKATYLDEYNNKRLITIEWPKNAYWLYSVNSDFTNWKLALPFSYEFEPITSGYLGSDGLIYFELRPYKRFGQADSVYKVAKEDGSHYFITVEEYYVRYLDRIPSTEDFLKDLNKALGNKDYEKAEEMRVKRLVEIQNVLKYFADKKYSLSGKADLKYNELLQEKSELENIKNLKNNQFAILRKHLNKTEPYKKPFEIVEEKLTAPEKPIIKSDVDELPTISAKRKENAYAIVIGIEKYRQNIPNVDFAVNDAETMTEYLTKVMGYPEENVVTLLNDRAAKSDFEKYLGRWLSNNLDDNGKVFIYYSGHGAPDPKTGNTYLLPYDGDPTFIEETGYSLKRLYDSLGKLKAKEIVVALDACFSGAGGRSVIAEGSRPVVIQIEDAMKPAGNMVVISAASGNQISSTYKDKGHGLFTYFLLKGLKGFADADGDGSIELDELYSYLKPQVERIARKKYNNEQSPQLIKPIGFSERERFYILKKQ